VWYKPQAANGGKVRICFYRINELFRTGYDVLVKTKNSQHVNEVEEKRNAS